MFVKSQILKSPHAFSTREGGVSINEHTSELNLAFGRGDEDGVVLENLKIFAHTVGFEPEQTVSMPQIHSNTVLKVGKKDCGSGYFVRDSIPEADGYITGERGVVLGVKTADCVPILLEGLLKCSPEALPKGLDKGLPDNLNKGLPDNLPDGALDSKVVAVGALHAGWRGTALKIAEVGVKAMCESFGITPQGIRACIGPCIHSCCYEVGEDLFSEFESALGRELAEKYIVQNPENKGKFFCELSEINREILLACGVPNENIEIIKECTCCHPEKFFSHRYSNGNRGTMLNVIFIK